MTVNAVVSDDMVQDFATSHLPWQLDVQRQTGLRHDTRDLGDCWTVTTALGGMHGHRGSPELRRTNGEYLALLLVQRGREVFTQHRGAATVDAGTALLWDGVRPAECHSPGPLRKITFFLPRELAQRALPRPDRVVGMPIPASPSLRLLFSWLETSGGADYLDTTAAVRAGRVAVDLLADALGTASELALDTSTIRLMEVRAFIDEQLADPDLTVADVARSTAMSVRSVHLLFAGTGETCGQYLSRRRLEEGHRLLVTHPALSVSEVARRCGFTTLSSFSRAYRAAVGSSPRETRSALRTSTVHDGTNPLHAA